MDPSCPGKAAAHGSACDAMGALSSTQPCALAIFVEIQCLETSAGFGDTSNWFCIKGSTQLV